MDHRKDPQDETMGWGAAILAVLFGVAVVTSNIKTDSEAAASPGQPVISLQNISPAIDK